MRGGILLRHRAVLHRNRYRRSGSRATMAQWARTQKPHLSMNMFSLMPLAEQMRWEFLYALQQRDARNGRMDPVAVRTGSPRWAQLQVWQRFSVHRSLSDSKHDRSATPTPTPTYSNSPGTLHDAHEEASGGVHTRRQVWDLVTLGLAQDPATHGGSRRRKGALDFTPITGWLNDITRRWAETAAA